jgi:hypothetical protein
MKGKNINQFVGFLKKGKKKQKFKASVTYLSAINLKIS